MLELSGEFGVIVFVSAPSVEDEASASTPSFVADSSEDIMVAGILVDLFSSSWPVSGSTKSSRTISTASKDGIVNVDDGLNEYFLTCVGCPFCLI